MNDYLYFLQENVFIWVIAVIGTMGCLAYSLAGKGLTLLHKETEKMTASNNSFIRQLKLRRENGMRINVNITNTEAFIVKNMDKYRYMGMRVHNYVRVGDFTAFLCLMLGFVAGIINDSLWYVMYAGVCTMAVKTVDRLENIPRKEYIVRMNMVDYFDNILTMDNKEMESEADVDYNINDMTDDNYEYNNYKVRNVNNPEYKKETASGALYKRDVHSKGMAESGIVGAGRRNTTARETAVSDSATDRAVREKKAM